jgi:DNA-directed RNA polymerase specialized sigma24 family protein
MTGFAPLHDEDLVKLKKILARLKPAEREALTRFYLLEHDTVRVGAEFGMSDSEFRELKARVRTAYLAVERPN